MNTLKLNHFPKAPYAIEEAINRLRINLSFSGKDLRKIMIISSTPQEGKSFVAVQLWRALAEAGNQVILVDGDFRKSVLNERYQFSSNSKIKGITYYLSGQATLEESVYHTNIENGDILPLIKPMANPSMLLDSELFAEMLDQLAEEYRYVIIDVPPIGLVADGERIASLCDGAVFIIGSGMVARSLVRNSLLQLKRASCPLIGVVLNRASPGGGGYYSKYGKYGKYGKYKKYLADAKKYGDEEEK